MGDCIPVESRPKASARQQVSSDQEIAKQLHERCRREHVSSNRGIVNATGVAHSQIKKFKRHISNSLDHDRIILLSIEVFNPFVDRHCFKCHMSTFNCSYHLQERGLVGEQANAL